MPPLKDATSGSAVVLHQTDAGGSSVATAFESESYLSLQQQVDAIADAETDWTALQSEIAQDRTDQQEQVDAFLTGAAVDLAAFPSGQLLKLKTTGGQDTWFFRIPKQTWGQLRPSSTGFGTTTDIHEAFDKGAAGEADAVYIAAFQMTLSDGELVSQPNRGPVVNRTIDEAIALCNGTDIVGFEGLQRLWSVWDRSLVINWCIEAGISPTGNTSYGSYYDDLSIIGQGATTTETGSMGVSSSHNQQLAGIYDLVGNVHEFVYGLETNDGRILMINDNASDSADRANLTAKDLWITAPSGDIGITSVEANQQQTDSPSSFRSKVFENFNDSGSVRRRAMLQSNGTDSGNGSVQLRSYGDRICLAGGEYRSGGGAGLLAYTLFNSDQSASPTIGIRAAFAI